MTRSGAEYAQLTRGLAKHRERMLRVARDYASGAIEAEDVVQIAAMTAWRRLGSMRDGEAIGPWLVRITKREGLAVAEKRRRRRQLRDKHHGPRPEPSGPPTPRFRDHPRMDRVRSAVEGGPPTFPRPLMCGTLAAEYKGKNISNGPWGCEMFSLTHSRFVVPDGDIEWGLKHDFYGYVDVSLTGGMAAVEAHFGASFHINSGYRCPKGNRSAGSETDNSRHVRGRAADFQLLNDERWTTAFKDSIIDWANARWGDRVEARKYANSAPSPGPSPCPTGPSSLGSSPVVVGGERRMSNHGTAGGRWQSRGGRAAEATV